LIELMIVLVIIGILAAVAIPNFIRFQARARQSEAKANLKAAFSAEKAYYQETTQYGSLIAVIGFSPERNNRYAYYLGAAGSLQDRSTTVPVAASDAQGIDVDTFRYPGSSLPYSAPTCNPTTGTSVPGVVTTSSPMSWQGLARGNLDSDTTIDEWSISTDSRLFPATVDATCAVGGSNPSGEPANGVNDVNF
jgi:type IV pilus assembly protein PilA